MLKILTISIDTEADCSKDWTGRYPESYENIYELKNKLLPVVTKYSAIPTLLLNADVIERAGPSAICKSLFKDFSWELGTHLHSELVEPQKKLSGPGGSQLREFQVGYPPEVEFQKILTLTNLFRDRFGFDPTSFRAGRFAANHHTFKSLFDLGYKVDTSIVPKSSFQEKAVIVDYRNFSHEPTILFKNDTKSLVNIPVTVMPNIFGQLSTIKPNNNFWAKNNMFFVNKYYAGLKRIVNNVAMPLSKPTWLRPSYSNLNQMKKILEWQNLKPIGSPIVSNMMFHSNELLPNASPYNMTTNDVDLFLEKIDGLLNFAHNLGYKFFGLTAAAEKIFKVSS